MSAEEWEPEHVARALYPIDEARKAHNECYDIFLADARKTISDLKARLEKAEAKQHQSDLNYDALEKQLQKAEEKNRMKDKVMHSLKDDWDNALKLSYQDGFSACKRMAVEVANNFDIKHPAGIYCQLTRSEIAKAIEALKPEEMK